ncbi:MAG: flagellar FliJ family protein [Candidatus Saganbacteria bacterium]|nr:flagellar FliJ family protein [Candidatus Saganbacteria bacterium]
MVRKPKPGKKFKYNLEPVLMVRQIKEKKEQEQFADKKRAYIKEKDEEERLKKTEKERIDDVRTLIKKGPIRDFADVLRRRAHLGVLKEDVEKQVEKVIDASKVLENQRVKLIDAMKDKKVMEKDKTNKLDQYKKLMENLEMKFMDEIATLRFQHDKTKE